MLAFFCPKKKVVQINKGGDMLTEVRMRESCCTKLSRALVGGLWGATCGILKPAAQWLLNAWDKIKDKTPANRGRYPVLMDILAASVVLCGSEIRFGMPIIWFFVISEGILGLQGAYRGFKMGWHTELQEILRDIPQELWVWEKDPKKIQSQRETIQSQRPTSITIWQTTKGIVIGLFAAATMPYVQLLCTILAAKRPLPVLINAGLINIYALYIGASYVGFELSLNLFAGLQTTLAFYGAIKGGYLGYTEDSTKVCNALWQGGLTRSSVNVEEVVEESTFSTHAFASKPMHMPIDSVVISRSSIPPEIQIQSTRASSVHNNETCTWMHSHQKSNAESLNSIYNNGAKAKEKNPSSNIPKLYRRKSWG